MNKAGPGELSKELAFHLRAKSGAHASFITSLTGVRWNKEAVGVGRAHRCALGTSWQGLLIHRLGGGEEVEFPRSK